jgi:hypothetical protein
MLALVWPTAAWATLTVGAIYCLGVLGCAVPAAWTHGLRCSAILAAAFPVLHCAYGAGFWHGLFDHFLYRRRHRLDASTIGLSR